MAKFRKLEEFFFAYFFNVIMDFYFNVIFAKKNCHKMKGLICSLDLLSVLSCSALEKVQEWKWNAPMYD